MLIFLISLVFLITSSYFFIKHKLQSLSKNSNPSYYSNEIKLTYRVFLTLFIFTFLISIFGTGGMYVEQKRDFEEVTKTIKVEKIYKTKAIELTSTFSSYLSKQYPNFEKDIFDKIKPETIPIYLVQYPDLKSSETIMLLVEKINKLQNDTYDQQIEREKILKRVRFRTKNIWWWNWTIPNYKMEAE